VLLSNRIALEPGCLVCITKVVKQNDGFKSRIPGRNSPWTRGTYT
jgi:hypothetical protein